MKKYIAPVLSSDEINSKKIMVEIEIGSDVDMDMGLDEE